MLNLVVGEQLWKPPQGKAMLVPLPHSWKIGYGGTLTLQSYTCLLTSNSTDTFTPLHICRGSVKGVLLQIWKRQIMGAICIDCDPYLERPITVEASFVKHADCQQSSCYTIRLNGYCDP